MSADTPFNSIMVHLKINPWISGDSSFEKQTCSGSICRTLGGYVSFFNCLMQYHVHVLVAYADTWEVSI